MPALVRIGLVRWWAGVGKRLHSIVVSCGAYWSFGKRDKSALLSAKKWNVDQFRFKCEGEDWQEQILAKKWQLSVKTVKISSLNVTNVKWECHGRTPWVGLDHTTGRMIAFLWIAELNDSSVIIDWSFDDFLFKVQYSWISTLHAEIFAR